MSTKQQGPTIGLMLPAIANTDTNKVDPPRVLAAAKLAEQAGFDGVYVGDHLLHPRPLLEAVVTLSAVAATTSRVSIGTCVMLAALRDPLWLAKQLGTLAAFAPGRLRIGIGLGGEYPAEFAAAGVPLAERGRRAEAVLAEVRDLLAGRSKPAPSDDGMAVGVDPVPGEDLPILLAGWKEVALRRAARLGDGWIGYLLSPDSFTRRRDQLLHYRSEHGGKPFITGMLLPVHPDDASDAHSNAGAAWKRLTGANASFPERLFVAGGPQAIVDQLHTYWQRGCTEMVLSLVDMGGVFSRQLDMLCTDVLPALRKFTNSQPNV
jgi:alkanesulfonate monooxygenase SsuD/methylene tetrahydromethanopterin reductase-like flavin-dependent oxidoreductase (luciferase family)